MANEDKREMLRKLYQKSSKHSNYQILATSLRNILNQEQLSISSRYEQERLDFILQYLELEGKTILDIGGNTGFFSLESLDKGARHVTYYEGNEEHAKFVELSAEILGLSERILVKNEYFDFGASIVKKQYDITFLLNVLHHFGDDYGDTQISIQKAKESIKTSIKSMVGVTEYLVFQLGYNWKGNRDLGLFLNGTKQEMIDYIKESAASEWDIVVIGIAEKKDEKVKYAPLSDSNIARNDSMGEFLNRPIFILKCKNN